ncbi:MAG: (d)CMP kinase [Sediminibacterium sp.]|jgi:CMP/dCMP kinase|nr:(d)CMP kinase [Sediminibacterium sp.]
MANQKIIIAIDGFSSCGKSTLAKAMAKNLEYVFIDTGAMYRAVALFFLRAGIDFGNTSDIAAALNKITLQFKYNSTTLQSDMYLNEENVEQEIREMRVSQKVSEVAALALVRDFAVAQQQAMGESKGIVMDGRDIGTVVFPKAELKIFITASPDIRVQRRFLELSAKSPAITVEEIAENLQHRDLIDTTREHSPLKQANDALVLDNSNMSREAQLDIALQWAQARISQANNQ